MADSPQNAATNMAALLRDVVEVTSKQQKTVTGQVRDGFVAWLDEVVDIAGVSPAWLTRTNESSGTVLRVSKPNSSGPKHPGVDPDDWPDGSTQYFNAVEALEKFEVEHQKWERHARLYDDLFNARTPSDGMEAVFAIGLLEAGSGSDLLQRHMVTFSVDIGLNKQSSELSVNIDDSARLELNWMDSDSRSALGDAEESLQLLEESQTHEDAQSSTSEILASFGLKGFELEVGVNRPPGYVGIGVMPAVLYRKRDNSALLDLLRDMTDDMESGGFVSEPFRMIVSESYSPPQIEVLTDRAALAKEANDEQREMIDSARREPHLVIQGPPGTGKTHTIANLASVLMAEGRRVLITAENERALEEVQSKLPEEMQPLMLPMLKERGKGALQASVNALSGRASGNSNKSERNHKKKTALKKLESLEADRDFYQSELVRISAQQHEVHSFQGSTMPVSGHQIALAAKEQQLDLVERFLSDNGVLAPEEANAVVSLKQIVTQTHRDLAEHTFPVGLLPPEEVAQHIGEYQSELGTLGPPSDADPGDIIELDELLEKLAVGLHAFPVINWTEITRTSDDYNSAAGAAEEAAKNINHGVTVEPAAAIAQAIEVCESYLALDENRFNKPFEVLVAEYRAATTNVRQSHLSGRFVNTSAAEKLTRKCNDALRLLRDDRTSLLSSLSRDLFDRGYSQVTTISEEAAQLVDSSRDEVGMAVTIDSADPAFHRLLEQAEALLEHYAAGGKSTRRVGVPKAVRDAADLIEQVRVGGSKIDNETEVRRAITHLKFRQQMKIVDSWAESNDLRRPEGLQAHEWLRELSLMSTHAAQIVEALHSTDELVIFAEDTSEISPKVLLEAALGAIGQEVVDKLEAFVAVAASAPRVATAGHELASREATTSALAALRAVEIRRAQHALLPESWRRRCSAVNTEAGDDLAKALRVCEQASAVPPLARQAELKPESVSRIREEAKRERRRAQAEDRLDQTVGEIRRSLMACAPKSPKAQAMDDALRDLNAAAYRVAYEGVQKEVEMASEATRLEQARTATKSAHPLLLQAIDIEDPSAEKVLAQISDFESLRDYKLAVEGWAAGLDSANEIHKELHGLHNRIQATESNLASLRCWDKAVDRLQGKRELRSALSALSTAMERVPKTRTAKSYPARVRALRKATEEAAPAIPCWVLSIDRIPEVLGYPTDDRRFDVVIIDEASQAWFPSMFLYAIADQVIVVGDKQQTSPSQVMSSDIISEICHKWIPGHRLEDQIGEDLSLYDVAEIMTGPDMMVDHFRCVPEIIEISNRLSYEPMGRSLKPLRVRKPDAMVPVKHVRVNGQRDAKSSNRAEIEALVQQVVECHTDPAYEDMDFGIVVVGPNPNSHLKHLRTSLLAELGATAMSERNIEVGTASQFQGAERNVMFLSLVVSPDQSGRIRLWPHEHSGRNRRNVQQLNVAVSRARDQLWIYHSFDAQHLQPNDARAILLDAAPAAQLDPESAFAACESQFERDVFTAIAEADPSLILSTQVEALGYFIDIVIDTPSGDRLAVECDGDPYHTSDLQIRKDLYRQRVLENADWRFHRFLASEWYGDPEKHLSEILAALPEPKTFPDQTRAARPGPPQPEPPNQRHYRSAPLPPGNGMPEIAETSPPVEGESASDRVRVNPSKSLATNTLVSENEERAKRARRSSHSRATQHAAPVLAIVEDYAEEPEEDDDDVEYIECVEEYVECGTTVLAQLGGLKDVIRTIVEVEGPVAVSRICDLVDEVILESVSQASILDELHTEGNGYAVWRPSMASNDQAWVRLNSQPYALPRTLGPRSFDEVSSPELVALFERLIEEGYVGTSQLYAAAREHLEYSGPKAPTRERLREALRTASY